MMYVFHSMLANKKWDRQDDNEVEYPICSTSNTVDMGCHLGGVKEGTILPEVLLFKSIDNCRI